MQGCLRFYLGIDAGATKTHALIADQEGHVRGGGHAGPGNWEGVGLDGAYDAYAAAVGEALASAGLKAGDLAGAGYALAGLDFPSDEGRLRPVVEKLGVPGPQVLVNDTYGALRAGTHDGVGVVVISGTGTTVAGCNRRGERFRTFGEGQMLGDVGGAGGFVWLAIQAVARAYTGRGRPTSLTERFVRLCGVEGPLEMIEGLCRHTIPQPRASSAPLVFEAAAEGDQVAQDIIRYVGHEQGANAVAIARRLGLLDEPFELVLAGGVFRSGSKLMFDSLVNTVREAAPKVQPVVLRTAPVAGSTLLAMDADGIRATDEVHNRLAEETQALLGGGAPEAE